MKRLLVAISSLSLCALAMASSAPAEAGSSALDGRVEVVKVVRAMAEKSCREQAGADESQYSVCVGRTMDSAARFLSGKKTPRPML